jgi:two-component system, NarL family, sensor kinase
MLSMCGTFTIFCLSFYAYVFQSLFIMNPTGNDIPLIFTAGIAFVLLLAISFLVITFLTQRKKWQLFNEMGKLKEQQQNQLIEAAVRSEETERHRIAETLHDEIGAILSSVRLHFSNINAGQLDERGKSLLEKSKMLLDDGIQKVRTISHNLHSTLLKEFGLNEAIRNFLGKTVQGTLVKVETDLDSNYHIETAETDLGVYRIVQELTNNILKHAHADFIHLSSQLKDGLVELVIQFNGSGLSQEEFEEWRFRPEGLGLKNIQNRIILLKGMIQFEKNKKDNRIILTIPVNTVK